MRPANEPCDSAEFSRKIRRTENRALSFPVINYKHTRILLQIANTHTSGCRYVRFNRGFSAAILRNGPSSRVHCAPGFRSSESRFARPNSNFCLGSYVDFRFECVCVFSVGIFDFFGFCAVEIGGFEWWGGWCLYGKNWGNRILMGWFESCGLLKVYWKIILFNFAPT